MALDGSAEFRTLVDVLRWRATHQQGRLGYRFLTDGESREVTLTYGDLDRRARAIAGLLQSLEATGERALLVYPPGLELICAYFGCLYAGAIAILIPPPLPARLRQFLSKAARISNDARPLVALTTSAILDELVAPITQTIDLSAARWLSTDAEPEGPASEWRGPAVTGEDLTFLQYTSGSTTEPKGVMVSHGNLMANLRLMQEAFAQSSDGGMVSWLPPYHDMGLIGGILGPLYVGMPVTLMPPVAFAQRPRRWLQAISRYQATHSAGPNFAYDLCVRQTTPEQRAHIDLTSWEVALNGAEPVSVRTIREFAEYFAPCGFSLGSFRPCYGLAESTLMVSGSRRTAQPLIQGFRQSDLGQNRVVPCAGDAPGAITLVTCGQPVTKVMIVDPDSLKPCPPDRVGEIWVSGPSVARGYWNHPAETEHTFRAHLTDTDAGPFLRTGDLGFLLDGELFLTGRLKDMIIVDGVNHYPQDIERTVVGCHPALEGAECAAFAVDVAGREELVVVVAVQARWRLGVADVPLAIRRAMAEHHDLRLHDVVLVKRGRIPKTASGKVRRRSCRAEYLEQTLDAWEQHS